MELGNNLFQYRKRKDEIKYCIKEIKAMDEEIKSEKFKLKEFYV